MAKTEERKQLLVRIDAPKRPTRLEDLVRDQYTIGRGDARGGEVVDFCIETDDAVSRLHCTLVREGDGYVLQNHSSNGTEVNGKLVEGYCPLQPLDVLRLGDSTKLEYLALTKAQRTKAFAALASGPAEKSAGEAAVRKSIFRRPWFLGLLGFYGLIAYVLLSTGGTPKTRRVADPGKGPYCEWLIKAPLREGSGETIKGARGIAERMWNDSLDRYGGEAIAEGGNAFRLLLRGREVLRILGYRTVREASEKEEVAAAMLQIHTDLESRVALLYARYKEEKKAGRPEPLETTLGQLMRTIPKSDEPLHAFAADQLVQLRGARRRGRGRR